MEALDAQAEAVRASDREADAQEDASAQHMDALRSQAEAAEMNTLRHAANVRADSEAREGNRTRFVLFLLMGIVVAVLLVVVIWLSGR